MMTDVAAVLTSNWDERRAMAQSIVDFEARRDAQGRLIVYYLPVIDGGGRYEVAGINERYHPEVCNELVALIEAGQHDRAEAKAIEYIASYTDAADRWCSSTAVEAYLRDCYFNRGPGGSAWILQRSVGVQTDRVVGPQTRAAVLREERDAAGLLLKLREAREIYERQVVRRGEDHPFWRGLVNRWNKALAFAQTFLPTNASRHWERAVAADVPDAALPELSGRILNCQPSKDTEEDWGFDEALATAGPPRYAGLPDSKDLRAPWWAIGNQGDTGSCVGWAAADSVLRWHLVSAQLLAPDELLSVRFIWMASKETDEFTRRPSTFIEETGTSLKAALDVLRRYGAVKDEILPFQGGRLYQRTEKLFYSIASQFKIASYFNLGRDLARWRAWLANEGPILTRLVVDNTFGRATFTSGMLENYLSHTAFGGHAVALVGYTPDHFIVRNSWSTNWGDSGFAYASNQYAAAAFTEAYGVRIPANS